jgi:hypothetical protein
MPGLQRDAAFKKMAFAFRHTSPTVGFGVPPRPEPRRHQLSVETVVPVK